MPIFTFRRPVLARRTGPHVLHVGAPVFFPRAVADGKPWWYLVRLRLKVLAGAPTTGRSLEVSAAVNGAASNSVLLRLRRGKRCRGRAIEWSSLDLIEGQRDGVECGRVLTVDSLNFTQLRAVREGRRILSIDLAGKLSRQDRLLVLPGSGIFKSLAGPGQLVLAKLRGIKGLSVGEWAHVSVHLFNEGDRPVRLRGVSVEGDHGLDLRPRQRSMSQVIAPGRGSRVSFAVRPHQARDYRLIFSAVSTANSPGLEVSIPASEPNGGGIDRRGIGLAVAAFCVSALFAIRRIVTS